MMEQLEMMHNLLKHSHRSRLPMALTLHLVIMRNIMIFITISIISHKLESMSSPIKQHQQMDYKSSEQIMALHRSRMDLSLSQTSSHEILVSLVFLSNISQVMQRLLINLVLIFRQRDTYISDKCGQGIYLLVKCLEHFHMVSIRLVRVGSLQPVVQALDDPRRESEPIVKQ